MVIFTETMANLVRELAACAGAVETEVSEETVSIRFCGGPGRLPPKPKDPAAGGKLRGGPDAVRGKSGRKLKTYAFDGETHTVREWAEKYGCTAKAMRLRLNNYGTPETSSRKARGEKRLTLKAKLSK